MTKRFAGLAPLLTLGALAVPAGASAAPKAVDIEFLGRTPAGGEATAEIAAFNPSTATAYATNADGNSLDLYDFSDPTTPTPGESIDLSPYGGGPNSVAFSPRKGGIVAVAVEADDKTDPGTVELFDADGVHLRTIPAGALPDMLTFARGGRLLLVANEGEPADDGSVDPAGSVTIVNLKKFGKPKVRTAGLGATKLRGAVRIYTPGATQAQDLEPEYITVARDRAYVSIQEANAVGVLDLKKKRFKFVRSLGFKDHGLAANALDPSDEDGIDIGAWDNVFGMYQPDALAAYTLKGKKKKGKAAGKGRKKAKRHTYVVTANEGDARDWEFFAEEERVGDLALDPGAFPLDATDDENLGRLNVTTTLGDTDGDDDFDQLYAFGGRSMSVLDRKAKVAFDTGSLLEERTADISEADFNKDNEAGSDPDNRSDNKGPEPEAVDIGKVGKRKYAFLGLERQGGVIAFDLSDRRGKAGFAGYANTREDDLGPEGLKFIPPGHSPTGNPLILVTYEISGTVAAYEVGN
jgi:hypothetical protein